MLPLLLCRQFVSLCSVFLLPLPCLLLIANWQRLLMARPYMLHIQLLLQVVGATHKQRFWLLFLLS
jgi:hypothetical protein